MGEGDMKSQPIQILAYISQSRLDPKECPKEVSLLSSQAWKRNAKHGITGVLIVQGTTFYQILEGPPDAVRRVFADIQSDDRHDSITILMNEPTEYRRFSNWSMECFHDPFHAEDFVATIRRMGAVFVEWGEFSPARLACHAWDLIGELKGHHLSQHARASTF